MVSSCFSLHTEGRGVISSYWDTKGRGTVILNMDTREAAKGKMRGGHSNLGARGPRG